MTNLIDQLTDYHKSVLLYFLVRKIFVFILLFFEKQSENEDKTSHMRTRYCLKHDPTQHLIHNNINGHNNENKEKERFLLHLLLLSG